MATRVQKVEHLVEVKKRLARKYDRLALQTGSRTRRRTYLQPAERYRRKAALSSLGHIVMMNS